MASLSREPPVPLVTLDDNNNNILMVKLPAIETRRRSKRKMMDAANSGASKKVKQSVSKPNENIPDKSSSEIQGVGITPGLALQVNRKIKPVRRSLFPNSKSRRNKHPSSALVLGILREEKENDTVGSSYLAVKSSSPGRQSNMFTQATKKCKVLQARKLCFLRTSPSSRSVFRSSSSSSRPQTRNGSDLQTKVDRRSATTAFQHFARLASTEPDIPDGSSMSDQPSSTSVWQSSVISNKTVPCDVHVVHQQSTVDNSFTANKVPPTFKERLSNLTERELQLENLVKEKRVEIAQLECEFTNISEHLGANIRTEIQQGLSDLQEKLLDMRDEVLDVVDELEIMRYKMRVQRLAVEKAMCKLQQMTPALTDSTTKSDLTSSSSPECTTSTYSTLTSCTLPVQSQFSITYESSAPESSKPASSAPVPFSYIVDFATAGSRSKGHLNSSTASTLLPVSSENRPCMHAATFRPMPSFKPTPAPIPPAVCVPIPSVKPTTAPIPMVIPVNGNATTIQPIQGKYSGLSYSQYPSILVIPPVRAPVPSHLETSAVLTKLQVAPIAFRPAPSTKPVPSNSFVTPSNTQKGITTVKYPIEPRGLSNRISSPQYFADLNNGYVVIGNKLNHTDMTYTIWKKTFDGCFYSTPTSQKLLLKLMDEVYLAEELVGKKFYKFDSPLCWLDESSILSLTDNRFMALLCQVDRCYPGFIEYCQCYPWARTAVNGKCRRISLKQKGKV